MESNHVYPRAYRKEKTHVGVNADGQERNGVMEKVAIPREVAEAITEMKTKGYSNMDISHGVTCCDFEEPCGFKLNEYVQDDADKFDTLIKALLYGFKIEQTPGEKLREYYESVYGQDDYGKITREAIRETLNMLGISIEGVNA